MKHYKKHIDQFFKEKLGNYRETPPPDAWDDLDARLDSLKPGITGSPYRWLLHVAIVSSLLFLSVSLVRKFNGARTTDQTLAQNTSSQTNAVATGPGTPSVTHATASGSPAQASVAPAVNTGNSAAHSSDINTSTQPNASSQPASATPDTKSFHNNGTNTHRGTGVARHTRTTHAPTSVKSFVAANFDNDNNTTKNSYTNNLSNPSPVEATETQLQAASPGTTLSNVPDANKQASPKSKPDNKPNTSTANSRTRKAASFPRFEIGVKTGFETGFSNEAAKKLVVSPYLQYNLTSRFSFLTQPAAKYAATPERVLSSQSFYQANPEDLQSSAGMTRDSTIGITTYHTTTYHYSQVHDSIVKTQKIGGSSTQFEIPLLIKYALGKKTSIYGGVNFVCSKLTAITENTYTVKGIQRTYDTTTVTTGTPSMPSYAFNYAGTPIADYQRMTAAQSGYRFSTGFMLGFSYSCGKKWMLDALAEQNPYTADVKAGYDINKALSATYFRLTLGYKLIK